MIWDPGLSLPAREFELSDAEVARIKTAVESWDAYGANVDRRWLEPLVKTLFSAEVPPR